MNLARNEVEGRCNEPQGITAFTQAVTNKVAKPDPPPLGMMPRNSPKLNSEPTQHRPNNTSTSRDFSYFPRRSKRLSRPATAFAALAVLASVSPSSSSASPVPVPFLEFLYPSFLSSYSSPATSSPTRHQQQAQQPSRELKEAVGAGKSRNKGKKTVTHPNVLSKRSASETVNVPTKYESGDVGWVIAESWDLHGRHRPSHVGLLCLLNYFQRA
jgi:hypothetical protein